MYRKRAPLLLGFFALLLVTGMGALAYDIAADQDDQDNEWTRQFGTPDNDFVGDVAVDESGNLYLVGWTDGALSGKAGLGNQDAYLRKYDGDGNELWTHQFGTQDYDRATGLALDNFGNPYVVGKVGGALPGQTHSGGQDAYLRKYDTDGTELWTRQFGTAQMTRPPLLWRTGQATCTSSGGHWAFSPTNLFLAVGMPTCVSTTVTETSFGRASSEPLTMMLRRV